MLLEQGPAQISVSSGCVQAFHVRVYDCMGAVMLELFRLGVPQLHVAASPVRTNLTCALFMEIT